MNAEEVLTIGEEGPRRVVVQAEGPIGLHDLDVSTGVVPWVKDGRWYWTVIVKMALRPGERGEVMVPAPAPALFVDVPSRFATDTQLLDRASDYALFKPQADIVIVGHARAPKPVVAIQVGLRIVAGSGEHVLGATGAVRTPAPAPQIPLAAPHLAMEWGAAVTRFGPDQRKERLLGGHVPDGLDPGTFQSAPPELRVAQALRGDEILLVTGLLPGQVDGTGESFGEVALPLPGIYPIVTIDTDVQDSQVDMKLDTLHLDTDSQVCSLSWRGTVGPLLNTDEVFRIVVSMERMGLERSLEERLADTQRGSVRYTWMEEDSRKGKLPPGEDAVITYHRNLTWGEVAPEPRVPLERYAKVSAELAEWPDKREETLRRHDFNEDRWLLEERCWLERFAANAIDGKGELASYYGGLYLAEQDKLAPPDEERRLGMRDFVGLRFALERAADPSGILEQAKVTFAEWLRLERRWTARAEADPVVAAEIDAMDAALRRDAPEIPDDDDDLVGDDDAAADDDES